MTRSRVEILAKSLLRDIRPFSHLVIKLPLRQYQLEPIRAILTSVIQQHGHEFLLVFPRQSGKNEAVAQLLVYLLNLYQNRECNVVYGAIGDALGMGAARLESRLDNIWNAGQWTKHANPDRRSLGKASVLFLSSHPAAATRGQTAHLLLVIDEAQDQDGAHIEQVFTPMRAANNATALYIGTVKTTSDFLWQKKRQLEQLELADGIRRVFLVSPDQVTAENQNYARFLADQVTRYGRHHPIVASEYFLEPIDGAGGLFDARRRLLMRGSHPRQCAPQPREIYVATLDVAGEDEAATDPIAHLKNPARDYTACTIFQVSFPSSATAATGGGLPVYRAVDLFLDHGSRHFTGKKQETPRRHAASNSTFPAPEGTQIGIGSEPLAAQLLAFLTHWSVAHIISDSTGVGLGITSYLRARLGDARVTPFDFAKPRAKAQLGSELLALIETNRFHYWSDADQQLSDEWWFFQQAAACAYEIPPDGTVDRDMRWSVHPSHRTLTPAGPKPTHDDRLLSAALIAELDRLIREGKLTLGTANSSIIPAVPDQDIY